MVAAKFITDEKILPAIYDLIDEAKENLMIISPYINLWGHLLNKIDKTKAYDILFIARKNQEGKLEDVINKLNELKLQMRVVENLHAKIYLNENKCIISSMNLYEFSTSNSKEIGVIIEDKETLRDIRKYIDEELIEVSELVTEKTSERITKGFKSIVNFVSKTVQNENNQHENTGKNTNVTKNTDGFCIRCKNMIKPNIEKPLCPSCYEKWKIYSNPTYKEKYCHICGKPEQTTVTKPTCISCYKKGNPIR